MPLLDAFVLVCKAVAFAHSKGVLHRDLKGANVILGEFGEVQLLDWGLAKPVTAPAGPPLAVVDAEDSDLTVTGGVVGTPAYLAPEVAAGGRASEASDVYGLGATLYAVLTGKPPADGPTPQAVLDEVRLHAPPPPRTINPAVPAALDAIVCRAMSRDPGQRYVTADELAQDVRDWLADEPVVAHPDGPLTRAARWGRRHRTWTIAAGVLLAAGSLALAAGTAAVVQEQRRTDEQRQRAEARRAALESLLDRLLVVAEAGLAAVPESEPAREALLTAAVDTLEAGGGLADGPAADLRLAWLHTCRGNVRTLVLDAAGADADLQASIRLLAPLPRGVALDQLVKAYADLNRLDADLGRRPAEVVRVGSDRPYGLYAKAQAAAVRRDWESVRVMSAATSARLNTDGTLGQGYGWVMFVNAHTLAAAAERELGRPADGLAKLDAVATAVGRPAAGVVPTDAQHVQGCWQSERAWCLAELPGRVIDAELAAAEARDAFDTLGRRHPTNTGYRKSAVEVRLVAARLRAASGDAAGARHLVEEAGRLFEPLAAKSGEWVEIARLRQQVEDARRRLAPGPG